MCSLFLIENLTYDIINVATDVKAVIVMKDLVRNIRENMQMNQEELAAMMGVSSVTISRWENGKAMPSLLAQKQLYDICIEHQLDPVDAMIQTERERQNVFYHASRSGITGRIQPSSRSRCDFGKGFYMGTDPLQPLTLVCNEKKPVFYTLESDMHGLNVLNVEVGLEWAMMIAWYRGYMDEESGSPIYERYAHMADGYDVISGFIADDRMYQVLTDFFEGRITDAALIGSLSALNLGKQYVAITQKACDQIRIVNEHPLQKLELMLLKDKSVVRRKEGIALVEKMVREHRRDGRYFDEILRGVA